MRWSEWRVDAGSGRGGVRFSHHFLSKLTASLTVMPGMDARTGKARRDAAGAVNRRREGVGERCNMDAAGPAVVLIFFPAAARARGTGDAQGLVVRRDSMLCDVHYFLVDDPL
jgi:hypothetical protein